MRLVALTIVLMCCIPAAALASQTLYDQNFEAPVGFVNEGGDINISRSINSLYGNQPPGFTFSQHFTVETLFVNGTAAFGTGYADPQGIAGNYVLGMLASVQNDFLGLAFDVGNVGFLNVRLDISSIDLDRFGGPFVPEAGEAPVFEFSLYDNPSGATGVGSGTPISSFQAAGTASPRTVFDWTEVVLAFDTSSSTNGKVILRIDLLSGGYAAMDNFRIVASDVAGDLGTPTATAEPSATPTPALSPPSTPTATETTSFTPLPSATPTAIPGPQPILELSPSSDVRFGPVNVGASKEFDYVARNAGFGTLTATATLGCSGFSVDPASFFMDSGEETRVTVEFAPVASGDFACVLRVVSDGGSAQRNLVGTGIGLQDIPVISSPLSWAGGFLIAALATVMVLRLRGNPLA